jgi:hypothetical protein
MFITLFVKLSAGKHLEPYQSNHYLSTLLSEALYNIEITRRTSKELSKTNNSTLLSPEKLGPTTVCLLQIVEDWKYVSMVLDRFFLWVFTLACIGGTCGIIFQAPSLYDKRKPIDQQLSSIPLRRNNFEVPQPQVPGSG